MLKRRVFTREFKVEAVTLLSLATAMIHGLAVGP